MSEHISSEQTENDADEGGTDRTVESTEGGPSADAGERDTTGGHKSDPEPPTVHDVTAAGKVYEATASGSAILEATEVEHSYGDVDVLTGVSLDLYEGAVTALIGPNGSGKTTFIRALAGLQPPTDGKIRYTGPDSPRQIGYLPQRPEFRSGQTVEQALTFYASLVGLSREQALESLDSVGLRDAKDRDVDALSGGMKRLVGIAQARIGAPPVVILDEPGSGLDPEMSLHVFRSLRELAADGTAVLLSSHDLALVEETADTVVMLDDGALVHRGPPDDVIQTAGADSLLDVFRESRQAAAGTVRVQGVSDDG